MTRIIYPIIALALCIFNTACFESRDTKAKNAAMEKMKENLVDPDSAQFDNVMVREPAQETPTSPSDIAMAKLMKLEAPNGLLCVGGNLNAKNKMGGYAGREAFIVIVGFTKDDETTVVNASGGRYEISFESVNKTFHCGFHL